MPSLPPKRRPELTVVRRLRYPSIFFFVSTVVAYFGYNVSKVYNGTPLIKLDIGKESLVIPGLLGQVALVVIIL